MLSSAHPDELQLTARLLNLADTSAPGVAAAMAGILGEISAALAPIVGTVGVAAILRRSVHVASADHAWLISGDASPDALTTLLSLRSDAEAAAGARACLRAFHELLVSLIGVELTERLLRPVAPATAARSLPKVAQ